jgi:hypothetical protein
MKKENELIMLLSLLERTPGENEKIKEILDGNLDWAYIAGVLYHHRLTGYFLMGMTKEQQKGMNTELLRNMKLLMRAQRQATLYVMDEVKIVTGKLEAENIKYAALKGLIFNYSLYEPGHRRSNDADLLICEEDLVAVDKVFRSAGYIQSYYKNEEFKEATRVEKVIQRMNYHDLVPYIKASNSDLLEKVEIDINFQFDCKTNAITKEVLDSGTMVYSRDQYSIAGLPWNTHFAHLCSHFYREATDTIWTDTRRDILLYKVVDIMNTFRLVKDKSKLDEFAALVRKLKLEKHCYYTMYQLSHFYSDENIDYLSELLKPDDISFLDDIHVTGDEDITVKRKVPFYDSAFDFNYSLKK